MKQLPKFYVIFSIIVVTSIIISFLLSAYIYYEQDEYYLFYLCNNLQFPFISLTNEHFTPFRDWLFCSQYALFGLSVFPRLIIAVFFHLFTLYLIYKILHKLKITHPVITPLLILLLATNVTISQAYLWLSTYSGTMPSIIFSLLSLIKFMDYLELIKKSDLIKCLLYLFIALLFKEYAIFLFPFYLFTPLLIKKFHPKFPITKFKTFIITICVFGFIYLLARSVIQLNSNYSSLITSNLTGNGFTSDVLSYISIGNKSLFQIILPYEFFFDISGLDQNNVINQFSSHIFKSILGAVLWIFILVTLIIKKKKKYLNHILLLLLILYSLSLIPFTILSPSNSFLMLENRYYYLFGVIWIPIISTLILIYRSKITEIILSLFLLVVIFLNISYFYSMLIEKSDSSNARKKIVEIIVNDIRSNDKDKYLIVYIDGNIPGYYGLPTIKIPFQSGFGNILAVNLFDNKTYIDTSYFMHKDTIKFYEINSEGVSIFNKRKTFGYFLTYKSLYRYVQKNQQALVYIHCYYWDYRNNKLLVETTKCKDALRKDILKKEPNGI